MVESTGPAFKRSRGERGTNKNRPSQVFHRLVHLYNCWNEQRTQALVEIRKQYREIVVENVVDLRLSDGVVEQGNGLFAVTASLREQMS